MLLKNIISLVTILLILSSISSCSKNDITDPFWDININWDEEAIKNKLTQDSKSGKIDNCVFSFEKVTYIKNKTFDAKVTSNLSNPIFSGNGLKELNYYVIAEFKGERVSQFNNDFYTFFKHLMKSQYGNNYEEIFEDDKIILSWEIPDNIIISVIVLKTINHYAIKIQG